MDGQRRGSVLIEFTLVGIPLIFMMTSIMMIALAMWQFETLAYGTQTTARFVVMHGRTCTQDGNSCTVTLNDIATYFSGQTIALDPNKTKLTLKSVSGTTTCEPLISCNGNTTVFPSAADNGINFDVTVTATYGVVNPLALFWRGTAGAGPGTLNLFATSRQRIMF